MGSIHGGQHGADMRCEGKSPYSLVQVIPPTGQTVLGGSININQKKYSSIKRVQVQFKNKIIQVQREQKPKPPDGVLKTGDTGKESYQSKHYLNSFKLKNDENQYNPSLLGKYTKNISNSLGRPQNSKVPIS
jgi:hypothetical protein